MSKKIKNNTTSQDDWLAGLKKTRAEKSALNSPPEKSAGDVLREQGINPAMLDSNYYHSQISELFRLSEGYNPFSLEQSMDYNQMLAERQSNWEKAGRGIKNLYFGTALGIVDSLAAWDLKGIKDMALGNTEENYGNWLNQSEFAKWLKEQGSAEIYTDGDDFGSFGYWARMIGHSGYTVGIILESLAEQALLSAVTTATLGGSSAIQAGSLASKLRLAKNIMTGIHGAIKGTHEAYMNGMETLNNVYHKMLQEGYSEEEARQKASEAATMGYRMEVGPLMALNALSHLAVFGKAGKAADKAKDAYNQGKSFGIKGFSDLGEEAIEKLLPNIKNKYAKTALNYGINSGLESFEEGLQTAIGSYAQHKTLKGTRADDGSEFSLWNSEMRDSMISGALMGGVFKGAGDIFNKVSEHYNGKSFDTQRIEFIEGATNRTITNIENLNKAKEAEKTAFENFNKNKNEKTLNEYRKAQEAVREAEYKLDYSNTVEALHYDYIKGEGTTAFDSHVGQLEAILQAVRDKDSDTLKKYGILTKEGKEAQEGILEYIGNTFEKRIKLAHQIKDKLNDNLLNITSDFHMASKITAQEIGVLESYDIIEQEKNNLNNLYKNSIHFNKMSTDGQKRFKLENELNAYKSLDRLDAVDKQRIKEIENELENTPEYSAQDAMYASVENTQQDSREYTGADYFKARHLNIITQNQKISDRLDTIKKYSKKENIIEDIKKRKENAIKEAKDKKSLEKAVEQANDDYLTESDKEYLKELQKQKEEEIKANSFKDEQGDSDIPSKPIVVPNSKEPDELSEAFIDDIERLFEEYNKSNNQDYVPQEEGLDYSQYFDSSRNSNNKTPFENYVKSLEKQLGREATLEDILQDSISRYGYERIEKVFPVISNIWSQMGRDNSNFINLRDKYFSTNLEQEVNDIYSNNTPEQVNRTNMETVKQIKENTAPIVEIKDGIVVRDNNIIEIDGELVDDRRILDSTPKVATLSISYEEIRDKNGFVSLQTSSNNLNENSDIDNHYILDPDTVDIDNEFEVSVPDDFENIKVAYWYTDEKGLHKIAMPFKEWVEKTGNKPGSVEYNNKIPLIAKFPNGDRAFFIHDTDWYNVNNISLREGRDTQLEVIKEGQKKLSEIRNSILNGDNKIVITKRTWGVFENLVNINKVNPQVAPFISLNEATGETILAVSGNNGNLYNANKNNSTEPLNGTGKGQLNVINKTINPNSVVEIRKVGKDQYIAFTPKTNNPLRGEDNNDIAYNNVKYAVATNLILNTKDPDVKQALIKLTGLTESKAEAIYNKILETEGINILRNLQDYVKMFTTVSNSESHFTKKLQSRQTEDENGDFVNPDNITYINYDDKTNQLKFFHKGSKEVPINPKNGYNKIVGINSNGVTTTNYFLYEEMFKEFFEGNNGLFRKTSLNVNSKHIEAKNKKGFVTITNTGDVKMYESQNGDNTYTGYIKDNLKTNIKSHKIKNPKGEDVWITGVQPIVNYKLSSNKLPVTPQTTEEVIEEVKGNTEPDSLDNSLQELKEQLDNLKKSYEKGILSDDQYYDAVELVKNEFGATGLEFDSRRNFDDDVLKAFETLGIDTIDGLTPKEQKDIIETLFNEILKNVTLDKGYINIGQVSSLMAKHTEEYLKRIIDEKKKLSESISGEPSLAVVKKLTDNLANKLENVLNQHSKLINGSEGKKGLLQSRLEAFFSEEIEYEQNENESLEVNDDGEIENNHSQSSYERDVKLSFSQRLKIFLSGIPDVNPRNNVTIKNSLNLEKSMSLDAVVQMIKEVTTEVPSSIDDILDALESKGPKYKQIAIKLRTAPEDIKMEINYKLIQSKLEMWMVLYKNNLKYNTTSLRAINANSGDYHIAMYQQMKNDFINSGLFFIQENNRMYNKEFAKSVVSKIDKLEKFGKLDANNKEHISTLKDIYESLGIELKDNVIKSIIESQGTNMLNRVEILGITKHFLMNKVINSEESIPFSEDFDLMSEIKNKIEDIIDIEIDLNGTSVAKSFRVGGKTIQGTVQKMMAYDIVKELKNPNSELIKFLKESPYSANNFVLKLLDESEQFTKLFNVNFVSLEALKQEYQKSYKDSRINKLSETDSHYTALGFFQSLGKKINSPIPGLNFRMAKMFTPTISDKDQMLLLDVPALELTASNFNITDDNIIINENIIQFLAEQLFVGEFDRIVQTYNSPTNIKNYNDAGKRFLSMPIFNKISIDTKEGIVNIHSILEKYSNDTKAMESLKEMALKEAYKLTRELLDAKVKEKINFKENKGEWFDFGFIEQSEKSREPYDISYLDNKYLKDKKGKNNKERATIAAYEFVLNSLLNNNNIHQLIAGDMALYAPKLNKKFKDTDGNIDDVAFTKAMGENITKRMAMMIAPGNKLANSNGDKYLQIFLNDPVTTTTSARSLLKQYYGQVSEENEKDLKELEAVEKAIQEAYKTISDPIALENKLEGDGKDDKGLLGKRRDLMDTLASRNSEIGGYFDIEGTDAQEYTTWQEHMDILWRQGRLTPQQKETFKSAYEKLSKGEDVNSEELKLIMQPIKPVYAGNNLETKGVNRIVYIKSSSVPLLPQLTREFKLDKVRQHMEKLQEANGGKQVRLSYQTANKVGAMATRLTVDDLYNKSFEELYQINENGNHKGLLFDSVLTLDRNNFKIQQDTPYKTDKFLHKNSEDYVTLGSQMWKIILGSGINHSTVKEFPNTFGNELIDYVNESLPDNEKIVPEKGLLSGRDLDIIKFSIENNYQRIKLEGLYKELGINRKTGKPADQKETILKLFKILKREVNSRDYPENIKDGLRLIEENGETNFDVPLWLSTGSNKFESLLQSVIANRLIKLKLPGNQHISTSSEGFERIDGYEELSEGIKSQIVWLDPNHTGELKSTRYESENSVRNQLSVNKIEGETLIYGDVKLIEKSTGKDTKKINFESKIRSKKGTESTLSYKTFNNLKELEDLIGEIDYENVDDIEGFNNSNNSGRIKLREIRISYDGIVTVNFINSEGLEQDWKIKNPKIKYNEDSKGLKESEVLIQSKFRVTKTDENGNKYTELIDLTKEPYSTRNKKGQLVINTGMIDESLLSMFSFRIPTSSHQSGAILKVVGFLPEASGDVLVVPKEHTKQLGEDYDIDKRNLYKQHYLVNRDGKIVKLTLEALKDKAMRQAYANSKYKEEKKELWEDFEDYKDSLQKNSKALYELFNIKSKKDLNSIEDTEDILNDVLDKIEEFILNNDRKGLKQFIKEQHQKSSETLKNYKEDILSELEELVNSIYNKRLEKLNKEFETSVLENAMIDVYKSVYLNQNPNLQKKINEILSFDTAGNTAKAIDKKLNSQVDDKYFTVLSDSYQRKMMKLGADGKLGTAIHSNAVTGQAQLERLKNKIVLKDPVINDDGKMIGYEKRVITIGNYTSDGTLGNTMTLDGSRSISVVHGENQNSAVDNVKAQIMGKRNENKYTINILTQLTYRGFDLDRETGYQIPSLFISQPIIRRYVELKEQYSSIASDYQANVDNFILEKLIKEFNQNSRIPVVRGLGLKLSKTDFLPKDVYKQVSKNMTGKVLYDNLINDPQQYQGDIQLAVLQTFFKLEEEAQRLGEYLRLINLSTSGLGVSYFGTLDKIDILNSMGNNRNISNLKDLVGEFIHNQNFPPSNINSEDRDYLSEEDLENIKNSSYYNGYTKIGDFWIKPTTSEGLQLVNSIVSSKTILGEHFPYENKFIKSIIETILEDKGDLSSKAKTELQFRIIDSFKSFIYSGLDLFEGDAKEERKRLFFDRDGNISLASFIQSLKKSKDIRVKSFIENNILLKDLKPEINLVSGLSILKIDNNDSDFNKTDRYNAFKELLSDNKTVLGQWQGEVITPMKLAQDLASYAYLANNEKGAIGFMDYIHQDYLRILKVSNQLRLFLSNLSDDMKDSFIRQFYQHNPSEAPILSKKSLNSFNIDFVGVLDGDGNIIKSNISNLFKSQVNVIQLKTPGPKYIAVRNPNKDYTDNKFDLFERTDSAREANRYVKIDTLGTFGFSEYNINTTEIIPTELYISKLKVLEDLVNRKQVFNNIQTVVKDENTINSYIDENKSLRENLINLSNRPDFPSKYKEILGKMLMFYQDDVKLKIVDSIENEDGSINSKFAGRYVYNDNTILIGRNIFDNLKKGESPIELLSNVILEEFIHALTVKDLHRWVDIKTLHTKPQYKEGVDKTPLYVRNLVELYLKAKESLPKEYYTSNIAEFVAGVFVDDDFKEKLDNIKDSNGKTLLQRFRDYIKQFLRYFTGAKYSDVSVNAVYDLLQKKSDKQIENDKLFFNKVEIMKTNDIELINSINELTKEDIKSVVNSDIDLRRLKNFILKENLISLDTEKLLSLLENKNILKREC